MYLYGIHPCFEKIFYFSIFSTSLIRISLVTLRLLEQTTTFMNLHKKEREYQ